MPVTEEHIETAKAIARRYGATRMVVFGSAVDDPEHARDLDLAIEGVEGWTIWELAGDWKKRIWSSTASEIGRASCRERV